MDETEDIIAAVKQASGVIENAQEQWEKYQQLKRDILTEGKNNPHINERTANQLIKFADEFKSDFGNVAIMESAVYLIKQGRNRDQIERIIQVAYNMATGGKMPYGMAVVGLYESLRCNVDILSVAYPELKSMTESELAGGKALDLIVKKIENKNQ